MAVGDAVGGRSGVDESSVRALAGAAGLALDEARVAAVTLVLAAWVSDANELSEKMSRAEHRGVLPVTVFSHPHTGTEGAEG